MRLLRLSLALLPVIAGVVTWWAARTSTQVRKDPEGHGLTIMLPGAMPLLNPFWQSGEIER